MFKTLIVCSPNRFKIPKVDTLIMRLNVSEDLPASGEKVLQSVFWIDNVKTSEN